MKLGTNDISSVYLGTNAVQKVYLGTNEVWSSWPGYVLDDYPSAAAAYSLRLLRSAYTGSAIRVRRASDNTEQDIGFIDNVLDTATLTSFCSGTNGFVTKWYDQSGNVNDQTQTTGANQPQIVSSGSVILENSKPSIYFNGSQFLNSASALTAQSGFAFAVFNSKNGQFRISQVDSFNVSGVNNISLDDTSSSNSPKYIRFLNLTPTANNIIRGNSDIYNMQVLSTYSSSGTSWAGWVNGNSQSLTTLSGSNTGNWFGDYQYPLYIQKLNRFGTQALTTLSYNQEIIIYGSDQSSNRTGIESNINSFYSIY